MNYAIYIIMAKNGMSPLRVLIQPYPVPSSSLAGLHCSTMSRVTGDFSRFCSFVRAV